MQATSAEAVASAVAATQVHPQSSLVQSSLSHNRKYTTSTVSPLIATSMASLREKLSAFGQDPSPRQLSALQDVVEILATMAEGTCLDAVHLSSLDPGMGKTTTLLAFLRELVKSEAHSGTGVLVCLSRIDEVKRLVEEAGLEEPDFAVLTRDNEANSLSTTPLDEAQVLFTTQQMLMKQLRGRSFAQCKAFYFLGSPRQVRVWDETLEPGEVLALSTDDLGGMLLSLRRFSSDGADQVQSLQARLAEAKPGSLLKVPEVPDAVLSCASACLPEGDAKATIDRLRAMVGQKARVCRGIGKQRIALVVRDSLPADLAPILVLDASGRIRETYKLWKDHCGGLVHLRSATKDYSPLSFHLMDQGAGKGSWQDNGEQLAKEVAEVINRNPGGRWLVIHYKATPLCDPEKLIEAQLSQEATRVEFLHWGAHQATNRFKDVENIILAGTLFLPESQLQGLAYASTGQPVGAALPKAMVDQITLGELGHAVVQAVGRGASRGSDGYRCRPCHVHIIAGKRHGLREALRRWFPGCKVKRWTPRHKPLQGRVADSVDLLKARLKEDPEAPILFSDIMAHIGERSRSNFNRTIRKHPQFLAALEDHCVEEVRVHNSRYFDAFQKVTSLFDADPEATCIAAKNGSHI